jgi:acetyl esterase/lipase
VADPEEVLTRRAAPPTTTVRYGALPDHVADVWLRTPTGPDPQPPQPLVIVIHGGFWRSGYGRTIAAPMSAALAAEGFAVAAIEYRRTGATGLGAGGWPMTTDDVRAAVERVPSLVAEVAGRPTGPTRLIGHSAGGHLALWAGSQATVPDLAGVVSLGGVCDLARADELRLGRAGDDGAVSALLGGRADQQPERYAAADPMRLPPPPAPVVLIHGVEDDVVPVELSQRYADYATARGADVTLVRLPGIDHFGPIDPLSPAWPHVLAALTRPPWTVSRA